jgi:D-alanine-D-alanine ligase
MRVCVLQPDYSTTDVDYKNYDPPRDITNLLPGDKVDHVFLNKLSTYAQLIELSKNNYDIFVNLCEGYLEWNVPSIDVPYYLELLHLPYTGPDTRVYDPSKEVMKYVAFTSGVNAPAFAVIKRSDNLENSVSHLRYPLFVKPSKAGDSLGIDENSLAKDIAHLSTKVSELFLEYDELLVEQYIDGREFTVLVVADPGDEKCKVYKPLEYIFQGNDHFKTYALKTKELHPSANIPCNDPVLEKQLIQASSAIFNAFEGVGYARLDFRVDSSGELFFLEINFTCSVFYVDGYEGSADYILKNDAEGTRGFLKRIIGEGIRRHRQRYKAYKVKGNALAGFGLYSTLRIPEGSLIFNGEGSSQRIITRNYVKKHWPPGEQEVFRRYAYPVSNEVYLLWHKDPMNWLPQNHSCDPNTFYDGLNVYVSKDVDEGVELTLDYSTFLNEDMEPFECHCGANNCRKWIEGMKDNSITSREEKKHPMSS